MMMKSSSQTTIRSRNPKLNLIFQFVMRYPYGERTNEQSGIVAKGKFAESLERKVFSITAHKREESERVRRS